MCDDDDDNDDNGVDDVMMLLWRYSYNLDVISISYFDLMMII